MRHNDQYVDFPQSYRNAATTENLRVIARLRDTDRRIQTALWLARVPVILRQLRAMRATAS